MLLYTHCNGKKKPNWLATQILAKIYIYFQYFSDKSGPIIFGNSLAVSYEGRHVVTVNTIIPLLRLYPRELKTYVWHLL